MKTFRDHGVDSPLYQWFHQNTRLTLSGLGKRRMRFPLLPPAKEYRGRPRLTLPYPEEMPEMALMEALSRRKSIRDFETNTMMPLETLSGILSAAYGVTHRLGGLEHRAAPSAGGRYPIEVYLSVRRVNDLDGGLYHYDPELHTVTQIGPEPITPSIWTPPGINRSLVENAACTLVFTAVFSRTVDKYGDRGYRYVFLDAGHLAQNVYLASTAYLSGCCAIGGFLESEVERELGIDGVTESAIYLLALGTPAF